jgi:hypothetical protein
MDSRVRFGRFAFTVLATMVFCLYVIPQPTPERDHYNCDAVLSSASGKFSGDITGACKRIKKQKEKTK